MFEAIYFNPSLHLFILVEEGVGKEEGRNYEQG
jgi:hypothetical protein